MNINIRKAIMAGVIGNIVMTAVGLWIAPLMGMPPMNPAAMLAGAMGGSMVLGWMGQFMIGITLAVGYALFGGVLPGAGWMRGAIFGIAPFLMAQMIVMPMMGMPFFSGFGAMAVGSLVGHLVFGGFVGGIYGEATEANPAPAAA